MKQASYPLISIVLPCYNVEKYLLQCLDSIGAQTYPNFEVIIVVDGATDKSFEIAREYCTTHERFCVIWQENAGSGPARNNGIRHSHGDYIMFVDPDDWIDADLVDQLYSGLVEGDYDLVATRKKYVTIDDRGKIKNISHVLYKERSIVGQDKLRASFVEMLSNGIIAAPTNKLYKTSIIRNNRIEFPSLRRSQDIVFNYRYYNCISSLKLLHYAGYNYRVELTNSIGRASYDYYNVIIMMYNDYRAMYETWKLDFPDKAISTLLFSGRINTHLQRCVSQGWKIAPVVNDNSIRHIIKISQPKRRTVKLLKWLLTHNYYTSAELYLKIIVKLKFSGILKKRNE